jgi:hypothetical protein
MLLTKLQTLHNNSIEMCFDLAFNNNTVKAKVINLRIVTVSKCHIQVLHLALYIRLDFFLAGITCSSRT